MTSLAAHLRFWSVAVLTLALDLWSKHWAFATLQQGGQRVLIPDVLEFRTTLNSGALFGVGAGQTGLFVAASCLALGLVLWMFAHCPAKRWLMQIALAGILAGALGNLHDRVFVRLVGPQQASPSIVLPMYCTFTEADGGRRWIFREYPDHQGAFVREQMAVPGEPAPERVGCVRDFIRISQRWFAGRELWPWIFNVADMLLVGGVAILAVYLLREHKVRPAAEPAALDAAGEKT